MPETKVPALADPVTVKDPQLKRVLASYKEALEIRLGRRGDKLDRAVTLRELVAAGMAKLGPGGSFTGEEIEYPEVYDGFSDLGTQPTTPTGFGAEGGFATVILKWDEPYKAYRNHSHTEIWRAPVDNLGEAILVGVSSDFMYSDSVGTGGEFYYWIRFVSMAGVIGVYNDTAGTVATTAIPADQIKQELLNSLGYEHFNVADGSFPIKLVDELPPLPDARFPQGATVSLLPNAILYRTANGSTWTQVVSAGEMAGQITTGQIAANAITSGKILAGAVLADNIATGAIVSDKIASNAVTSAKIVAGAVTADKISVSQLSAVSSDLGSIQVGTANIQNAAVDTIKIRGNAVTVPASAVKGYTSLPYVSYNTAFWGSTAGFTNVVTLSIFNPDPWSIPTMINVYGRHATASKPEGNQFAVWSAALLHNGSVADHTGLASGDFLAFGGRYNMSPGWNTFEVRGAGVSGYGTGHFGAWSITALGVRR